MITKVGRTFLHRSVAEMKYIKQLDTIELDPKINK